MHTGMLPWLFYILSCLSQVISDHPPPFQRLYLYSTQEFVHLHLSEKLSHSKWFIQDEFQQSTKPSPAALSSMWGSWVTVLVSIQSLLDARRALFVLGPRAMRELWEITQLFLSLMSPPWNYDFQWLQGRSNSYLESKPLVLKKRKKCSRPMRLLWPHFTPTLCFLWCLGVRSEIFII